MTKSSKKKPNRGETARELQKIICISGDTIQGETYSIAQKALWNELKRIWDLPYIRRSNQTKASFTDFWIYFMPHFRDWDGVYRWDYFVVRKVRCFHFERNRKSKKILTTEAMEMFYNTEPADGRWVPPKSFEDFAAANISGYDLDTQEKVMRVIRWLRDLNPKTLNFHYRWPVKGHSKTIVSLILMDLWKQYEARND